ncbi:MAG: 4-hydroxy-3-methylbut-2-enyl diphosphate reductase [Candidatus Omnitrophica bacterium]|nr:4-hydroxy-3-methylbut-2-enyl diphosphate reductase [Candidatus Omnitrophota bacterium]
MRINLAKSAGFCFGVRRAIKIALDSAGTKDSIEMLEDIVHNENVVRDIRSKGIKKVKRLAEGKQKALLIQAHGIAFDKLKQARKLNYAIIDATCPRVKEIHKIAVEKEKDKYRIIILGDRRHVEVQGIVGQLKNRPLIIENINRIPVMKLKGIKKACLIAQSTQNTRQTKKIAGILKELIRNIKICNTICNNTVRKQNELRGMSKNNDVMIIIGSKTSANTKRLYEISHSINKRTFWVQSAKDLRKGWLKGCASVGLTAGASTPDYTTRGVISSLKQMNKANG